MGRRDRVEIEVELLHETESALLISDGAGEYWVPKSLCSWDDDEGVLSIEEWKAEELGLI